jgi:hypothetical protein
LTKIHAIISIDGRPYPKRVVHPYDRLPTVNAPITGRLNGKVETFRTSEYLGRGYLYFMLDEKIKYISTPTLCEKYMNIEVTTEES